MVRGPFLSIVPDFLSDRRQRARLDGKVGASVNVVSRVPQGSILASLLFILSTSRLFRIVENHIVGYADDTTMYAVISQTTFVSSSESLNQDLVAINSSI